MDLAVCQYPLLAPTDALCVGHARPSSDPEEVNLKRVEESDGMAKPHQEAAEREKERRREKWCVCELGTLGQEVLFISRTDCVIGVQFGI